MWPWGCKPDDLATVLSEPKRQLNAGEVDLPNGGPGSHLLPPKRAGPTQPVKGSFSAVADMPMTDRLLQAAIPVAVKLVLRFRSRGETEWSSSEDEDAKPPPACPWWLFKLRNLTHLCIRGYPHRTLPDDLGALESLEHLHCYGSALTKVPRSVGQLQRLKEIDLYGSYDLHYLPYEIVRCSRLNASRSSTRVLFNNRMNGLALPELPPWWTVPASAGKAMLEVPAPSPADINDCLQGAAPPSVANTGLPVHVRALILAYLDWNSCSVCARRYADDFSLYTWAHRNVGTDAQALLAFCCSRACAASVQRQWCFDPSRSQNVEVTTLGMGARCGSADHGGGDNVCCGGDYHQRLDWGYWHQAHLRASPPRHACGFAGPVRPPRAPVLTPTGVSDWLQGVNASAVAPAATAEVGDGIVMEAVAAGGCRIARSSTAHQCGRLAAGTVVRVHRSCGDAERTLRTRDAFELLGRLEEEEEACDVEEACAFGQTGRLYWTAVT